MPSLASARYGKDNVRVCKVERDPETRVHTVTEMTVCCLLEGDIETSYTEADNSVVVATDSIKNTIYIKAKELPVNPPELFASGLGAHFVSKYAHITTAHVKVVAYRWKRLDVDGQPHPHAFQRDGEETREVEATVTEKKKETEDGGAEMEVTLNSGISGLTVLKSTGSAFWGFWRDEYTTLPETQDRILSTDVDCRWRWQPFASADAVADAAADFDAAWAAARRVTLDTFANDDSASVQNTMYKMCGLVLAEVPRIDTVTYSLPNKHYFEIDLSWHKGLKNTGEDAEVYAPQSDPNGLIKCEVARS